MTQNTNPVINRTVLMSGADYFGVVPLNPYSFDQGTIDREHAIADFNRIRTALEQAGIKVIKVDPPADCQDGVFTANWGVCRGDNVVLSSLPKDRANEMPYAEKVLSELGKKVVRAPYRFSGQGDALPCGNLLFAGSGYRTDPRMHEILANELGYEVISLKTVPHKDTAGNPIINERTGWPDSYFYDIDLALCILRKDLIAWCPEAFTPESQEKIRALDQLEKIEVSFGGELDRFDCNLVSTGSTVIMTDKAQVLKAEIEKQGMNVITVDTSELAKGGGGIRCSSLTLDNE